MLRAWLVVVGLGFAASAAWSTPATSKETLNVNLPGEPATLDPHLQWDTDSYTVYRNIFDNLVTRDVAGEIVPQIATEWTYLSDTEIAFTIRDDVTFHDGTRLTPEDVAFSINRIIDPELRSPQLTQFNTITGAEVSGEHTVLVTTSTPYPVLLAQLVKLSIVPKAAAAPTGSCPSSAVSPLRSRRTPTTGAASRRSIAWCSAPCLTARPASPTCAPAAPT
jgi:peptide/nickel transport system substrate-binding protein